MSSAAPTPARPATPVEVEIPGATVTLSDHPTHPIDLTLDGKVYGLTLEEALDLAAKLREAFAAAVL